MIRWVRITALTSAGKQSTKVELGVGSDPLGSLTRSENRLAKLPHGWTPHRPNGRKPSHNLKPQRSRYKSPLHLRRN